MLKDYGFVILGGGSAAFSAAIRAHKHKVKTAMINSGSVGGTCIGVGCVSSKHLLEIAGLLLPSEASYLPFSTVLTQ